MSGGMAPGPLTFSEIDCWCNRTGVDLAPWEARALRRLSIAYLNESHAAEKRDRPAPWVRDAETKPQVSETQLALRALARI